MVATRSNGQLHITSNTADLESSTNLRGQLALGAAQHDVQKLLLSRNRGDILPRSLHLGPKEEVVESKFLQTLLDEELGIYFFLFLDKIRRSRRIDGNVVGYGEKKRSGRRPCRAVNFFFCKEVGACLAIVAYR